MFAFPRHNGLKELAGYELYIKLLFSDEMIGPTSHRRIPIIQESIELVC